MGKRGVGLDDAEASDCIIRQRVSAKSLEVWASRTLRAGEKETGRD